MRTIIPWLGTRPPWLWRLAAVATLAVISAGTAWQASIVIDGKRYFWLDDDQMISMRYARNLAQGHGLVWNPGERVEGYTNFLWTLIMAGVHALPVDDARTSAVVAVISWALAAAILLLSERLLRFFLPQPGLALPALLLSEVLCVDVVFWSVNGFETTLLTAVFLLAVVRLLHESRDGRPHLATYVLLGLLPLVRSDALHVWAAAALLAIGLMRDRLRVMGFLALSLLLPAAHLLWRHGYYGEWLPNTYYLKVSAVPDRLESGLSYVAHFVFLYGVPLAVGGLGAILAGDRRRLLLLSGLVIGGGYVATVGADLFQHSRYLAHLVPIILALAFVAPAESLAGSRAEAPSGDEVPAGLSRTPAAQLLFMLAIFLGVFSQVGVTPRSTLLSKNGVPPAGVVTGVLIDRHTRPEAKVAVVAAGAVPYFSRRYTVDLLGKTDAVIARLPAHANGVVGHNKFDLAYSLGREPDLLVTLWPQSRVKPAMEAGVIPPDTKRVYNYAIVTHPIFRQLYAPNPVPLPYVRDHMAVYVRGTSPELAHLGSWRQPRVAR